MKDKRVSCSSKVSEETIHMLDELHDWTGMTKGKLVDLAISNLYSTKNADKSLMNFIHKQEDREIILNAIKKEYSKAYEKVIADIEKHYH